MNLSSCYINTPAGPLQIFGDGEGIGGIRFADSLPEDLKPVPRGLEPAVQQLKDYFAGTRNHFTFPLQISGTPFQEMVWSEVRRIPAGETMTYQELADKLKNPEGVRAVAAANAANPLLIVIPCHRVIGTDGKLTGYAGGLDRKAWLLQHESGVRQMSLF